MLQLDSACLKGPETTLEGVLIVVKSCRTTDRKICNIPLLKGPETTLEGVLIVVKSCRTTDRKICNIPLYIPKPCSLLGTIYTFLAIWQCVHRCFGKCFHSTHTRPLAVRPFLSALCLVVGRGV